MATRLAPRFQFTQDTVFATSRNDKTIVNDGNIAIITFRNNPPFYYNPPLQKCREREI